MPDKILIVDMTHGGVKLALQFLKENYHVHAWDIYHTLNEEQKKQLTLNGVELVDEDFLVENNPLVVAPVHCNLEHPVEMTHHQAVAVLMKEKIDIPVIEVTGVKGKTSTVYMLREIFKDLNPLILSSLGVEVNDTVIKSDVSITPANIINTWELGKEHHPGIFIWETSLGGTGLARVGVLTNIAEDYPIASGCKSASQAKAQIFMDELVVCDFESSEKIYSEFKEKTNTFSLTRGNVKAKNITYGLKETSFLVEVQGLKTVSGETLDCTFPIWTFAPAPYHLENALCAICAALTCGKSTESIKEGLKNFHGLRGRTSVEHVGSTTLIEEINPGINVTAVGKAVEMVKQLPQSAVVFGGKYGVTCEEIDEKSVSRVLNDVDEAVGLVLTDELGAAVKDKIKRNLEYREDVTEAVEYAQDQGYQNILVIYRSNFPDIIHR